MSQQFLNTNAANGRQSNLVALTAVALEPKLFLSQG